MAIDSLPSVQVVDGDGNFRAAELESFARAIKLSDCGLSYAVVSIMGPQSSGWLILAFYLAFFLIFAV